VNCKICNSTTDIFHKAKVLNKYTVAYFKCSNCGFIQTEDPYWLSEAYTEAIATTDVGLVGRNLWLRNITTNLLQNIFPEFKTMLDYGGGYGLFVRLMRDSGFDFYRQDIYCKNLFAEFFDVEDRDKKTFDLLTAFEVFEHLKDPVNEVDKMFSYAPTIFFSTELAPASRDEFSKWWYLAALSGQHIAFYNRQALIQLAKHFDKRLYSNNINLHILTDIDIDENEVSGYLTVKERGLLSRIKDAFKNPVMKSLTEADHKYIESKIESEMGNV
jgi:2-polyprenyl-3-methyl-5-hydroxy-6-metoxy-1,4-benzoquinol methylase